MNIKINVTMKAVLIDDDELNIILLQNLLSKYCPTVKVLGTATNVESALELVMNKQPDVLFLDIELHNLNATDLLNSLDLEKIQVIVISAHEKYALKMHKYPVTDYLLKPLQITELISSVNKAQRLLEKWRQAGLTNREHSASQYIALPERDHLNITNMQEIIRLEASGNYTKIITRDDKTIISSKTLGEYEGMLPDHQFLRVHHSHIVNLQYVSKYIRTKNGSLILKNGMEVPISANRKRDVTERILF
jgi:two-component system, LytTR family, response regulator